MKVLEDKRFITILFISIIVLGIVLYFKNDSKDNSECTYDLASINYSLKYKKLDKFLKTINNTTIYLDSEKNKVGLYNVVVAFITCQKITVPECYNSDPVKKVTYIIQLGHLPYILENPNLNPEDIAINIVFILFLLLMSFSYYIQNGDRKIFKYNSDEKYIEIIKENINEKILENRKSLEMLNIFIYYFDNKIYINQIVDIINKIVKYKYIEEDVETNILEDMKKHYIYLRLKENSQALNNCDTQYSGENVSLPSKNLFMLSSINGQKIQDIIKKTIKDYVKDL